MRIEFNTELDATAIYSESLIRGVILNASLASQTSNPRDIINFNSACVFFAVAFLEARLNETVSKINSHGASNKKIPARYWELLKEQERVLDFRQKWDYIAAGYNGILWDAGKEPFQSFEIVNSLRNELVHYKGEKTQLGRVPQKKLENLMSKFKGKGNEVLWESFGGGKSHWLYQILSSPDFGKWVAKSSLVFDVREKELLSGKKMESLDETLYWSKWDQILPFTKEVSKCNFKNTERVFDVLEKAIAQALVSSLSFRNNKKMKKSKASK